MEPGTRGPSKRVIAVAGMPGAGKTVASAAAHEFGYPVLAFGDIIREEAERRRVPPTPENLGKIMLEVRGEEGPAVMAKRLIPKIDGYRSPILILDGARSTEEVEELRRRYRVTVVAVHASPVTRFRRLQARGRSDDPKTWKQFITRDERELAVGIGKIIALADEMLINEGTVEELRSGFRRILEKVSKA